ncbi:hypothetical protein CFOL_v3_08040, partial [Cephalotus follicularis]
SPGLAECNEICYKDPVLKDHQWSAYIDRSPGAADYSEECFCASKAGCGYKVSCVFVSKIFLLYLIFLYFTDAMIFVLVLQFDIHPEKVEEVRPNRQPKPPPVQKPPSPPTSKPSEPMEDVPCTSA